MPKNLTDQRPGAIIRAPFGRIAVRLGSGCLQQLELLPGDGPLCAPEDALAVQVAEQLAQYFEHGDYRFSLPLHSNGSEFQRRVWQALSDIPAGAVRTYGDLARALGTSARAVGGACRANPLPIVVPCHRVVSAAGIGGFAGHTSGAALRCKSWLLRHEGVRLPAPGAGP